MAYNTQSIRPIHFILGGSAFALLLLLTLGTVIAVWARAEITSDLSPSDWSAIRFTISQAFVSAVISVLVAIPVARALARQEFKGRQFVLTLMGAPFILPAIVAVLAILAVWGRSGIVSNFIDNFGLQPLNIYGFSGVVLCHVFFNIPLTTRLLVQGWFSIPAEHFRASAQLGMRPRDVFRHLEIPMLRAVVPGAFLLVFLLCITSFAVALSLGGGPKATTVELAIYQALRFDFDLGKASQLATIQFLLCAIVGAVTILISQPMHFGRGLDRHPERWDGQTRSYRAFDLILIALACLFLFIPLFMIVAKGITPFFTLPLSVWLAAVNSVTVAVISSGIAVGMSICISALIIRIGRRKQRVSQMMEIIGFLTLAASPFVMGTGLFVILYPFISPTVVALPVTALVNAAMSLPFALRVILPAMSRVEENYGRLADSVGMETWARFRIAIWPRLQRPVGFAAGLSAALSMGDLGVIELFAAPDTETLPKAMYRLMSSYQLEKASGAALLLVGLSLSLFWLFDRGGRLEHNVR